MVYTKKATNLIRLYRKKLGYEKGTQIALIKAAQLKIPVFRKRKKPVFKWKKQKTSFFINL